MDKASEGVSGAAAPNVQSPSTVSDESGGFFRRSDWIAAAVTAAVSLCIYVYTLAPEVTLEDSGEFITASHNWGVPHPPGYPLWTMLTWLTNKLPFGNIAWRVNLFSAICGAITNGLLALLISRSAASFLDVTKPFCEKLSASARDRICEVGGIAAGLIFAVSDVMWSQSVISEVYALNTFFLVILMVLMFMWIHKPQELRYLYWTAFWFGLGLTNHQTLVVIFPAFAVMVFLVNRAIIFDYLIANLIILATVLAELAYLSCNASVGAILGYCFNPTPNFPGDENLVKIAFRYGIIFLVLSVGIVIYQRRFAWKPVLGLVLAFWFGLLFYCYMPLSSSTNPPMNWGYCRVKEGIYHHITRGQYEGSLPDLIKKYGGKLVMVQYQAPPPSGTPWTLRKFYGQINSYFEDLSDNFTLPLSLLALVVFFFYRDLSKKDRAWIAFQLVLFAFLVPFLIKLLNPEFDKQTKEIQKVFFVLSHAVYSVWIGYGVAFLLGLVAIHGSSIPLALPASCAVALALWTAPAFVGYGTRNSNWFDAEQRGHLFGYYFGHDMFETHPGLKKLYRSMDRDAVLYGGTDPGRFVPTYMIFCESRVPSKYKCPLDPNFDRHDVYIITQNALADNTYMNYIRDHYAIERPDIHNPVTLTNRSAWQQWMFQFGWNHLGRDGTYPKEPIWIPNVKEVEKGFEQYVRDLPNRPPQEREGVRVEGGKVSIQGVQGVMAINGIISQMIFEKNKDKHGFYVEESYVIPWMYPYLEPFQIIMKINKEPLPRITEEIRKRDREFWDEYCAQLLFSDPKFHRDEDAKKSFSKLRTAIAGLYTWRGANGQPELNAEAEYAYRQALQLCPDSPETNFRYVELLSRLERYDDALDVLEKFKKLDPYNQQIFRVMENVRGMKKAAEEQVQWEERYKLEPTNIEVCLRLIQYYAGRGRMDRLDKMVDNVLQLSTLTTNHLVDMAKIYAQLNRLDRVAAILDVLTRKSPEMAAAWYDLAVVNGLLYRGDAALNALEQAIKRGGEQFRSQAKQDQRLDRIRALPRYKEIVGE